MWIKHDKMPTNQRCFNSPMELELNFTVVENTSTKGGIDLKIISVGGDTGVRTEQVQKKVRLKFDVPVEAQKVHVPGSRGHSTTRSEVVADIEPLK